MATFPQEGLVFCFEEVDDPSHFVNCVLAEFGT
jgi:hypothetical protein